MSGWRATVLTLFPEMFPGPLGFSLAGRALERGAWSLEAVSLRYFAADAHRSVDDTPFGGGAGMVLRVDVVEAALDAVYGGPPEHRVLALSPQGRQLDQALVEELAREERLTVLSARFEGFDARVVDHVATDAVSIGPYVLSGGELPAMVILDAVARRLPGAIREESGLYESFSPELEGGVEFPQYTRPADFRGWRVPEVLVTGDHARIDEWRREQSRARSVR